jgi:hypothetical protein
MKEAVTRRERWEIRQAWSRHARVSLCPVCGSARRIDAEVPPGLCVPCWNSRGRHIPMTRGAA